MTKFFFSSQNLIFGHFWPISPIFGAKKVFAQIRNNMHNLIRASGTMPKFRGI